MLKRIISIFSISLIITGSFFSVYSYEYNVFAASPTDEWLNVTNNEQLAEAFRYYCKSRDLTIEGSLADGLTTFTTNAFNGLCNTLGIDITALQANIKYQTDNNTGTKFLFNALSIDAYNRIFAQFLQDNDLSVGDSADQANNTVYSGEYFTDLDGNSCLVFQVTQTFGYDSTTDRANDYILAYGTPLKYSSSAMKILYDAGTTSFTYNLVSGVSRNISTYRYYSDKLYSFGNTTGYALNNAFYSDEASNYPYTNITADGYGAIYRNTNTQSLYFGRINFVSYNNAYNGGARSYVGNLIQIYKFDDEPDDIQNVVIYLTTNNTTINNNNYEGDTVINNNGDTNNYYPDTPDTPDPPTIPDSGGWQDFSLPDMPNDWLIYGMEKKFPFDIPFNIMFALSLLNHEPEIPHFEGDIDLKVCTWHYDIDLTPFDDIATILRKFEVLAFIIGLAILTKNLINWG